MCRWWSYDAEEEEEEEEAGDLLASIVSGKEMVYSGWEQSRAYLLGLWEAEGPFDGVIGFSQGAVALHLLLREASVATAAAAAAAAAASGSAKGLAPAAPPPVPQQQQQQQQRQQQQQQRQRQQK